MYVIMHDNSFTVLYFIEIENESERYMYVEL